MRPPTSIIKRIEVNKTFFAQFQGFFHAQNFFEQRCAMKKVKIAAKISFEEKIIVFYNTEIKAITETCDKTFIYHPLMYSSNFSSF